MVYTVDLTKARIDFVEDSSSQQTETTVSNNNKCITKVTIDETSIPAYEALPNCKAKSTLLLDSINTNNSTSVEYNCQPLAQNKFNIRRPIQKLTDLPPPTNYFYSSRLQIISNHIIRYTSALYRNQNHVT